MNLKFFLNFFRIQIIIKIIIIQKKSDKRIEDEGKKYFEHTLDNERLYLFKLSEKYTLIISISIILMIKR